MNLLAIDTSSLACSVALQAGSQFSERHEELAREHTRLLMPMIRDVLLDADLSAQQLDAVVLGNGPGSFIGMRIAASVAQGLAHGADLQIVPVSSLAAVAAEVIGASDADEVVVAQDAHMSEVYLGAFRRNTAGLPELIFPERLQTQIPIEGLGDGQSLQRVAAGYGWERYPELAALNRELFESFSGVRHPRARFLLALGKEVLAHGAAICPEDLMPAYLRSKVASPPASG